MELFANFGRSRLQDTITSGATILHLTSGDGVLFPSPGGSDYFNLVLDDGIHFEIVKVNTRSVDTLTVVRAQQSTAAYPFLAGDKAANRLTAGTLTDILNAL